MLIGVMVELTISSRPHKVSKDGHDESLLSTLSMIGDRSSIHGFVVPIGSPR